MAEKTGEGRWKPLVFPLIMAVLLLVNSAGVIYLYTSVNDSLSQVNEKLMLLDAKTEADREGLISFENKTVEAFKTEQEDIEVLQEEIRYESETRSTQNLNINRNMNRMIESIQDVYESLENISDESRERFESIYGRVGTLEDLSEGIDIERVRNSVVSVETNERYGSGVVLGCRGYILTNYHVVEGYYKKNVDVKLYSGEEYTAKVFSKSSSLDLALLRINEGGLNLSTLGFEDAGGIEVGDTVYALGNPYGLDFTVTEGIISAFRVHERVEYIQTDVSINPGNSGGPLVNEGGRIVGLNSAKIADSEGLGFAIHVSELMDFVEGKIE